MDGFFRWALNVLIRKGTGIAVNKGADLIYGPGKTKAEMTPEERMQHKQAKQSAKRLRQSFRIGRRLW